MTATTKLPHPDRRHPAGRRITDSISPDLTAIQKHAASRASALTIRHAARLLSLAGQQAAAMLLLERAHDAIDAAVDETVRG